MLLSDENVQMNDDFEDTYEWDGLDPYLVEEAEEMYGAGEGKRPCMQHGVQGFERSDTMAQMRN